MGIYNAMVDYRGVKVKEEPCLYGAHMPSSWGYYHGVGNIAALDPNCTAKHFAKCLGETLILYHYTIVC